MPIYPMPGNGQSPGEDWHPPEARPTVEESIVQKHARNERHRVGPVPLPSHRKVAVTPLLAALGPVVYAAKTRKGYIKIGWTSNLAARQRHHGKIADILAWRTGTLEDEQAIHADLSGLAIKGREYYPPNDRQVLAIINSWREDLGIQPLGDMAHHA